MTNIDQMAAGAELDLLIETEIFGSIPLTDDEWKLCLAMMEYRDPHFPPPDKRMIKVTTGQPTHYMKLMFSLQWPRQFSTPSLGDQSRYVVEKMRADGWLFELFDSVTLDHGLLRVARFVKKEKQKGEWMIRVCEGEGMAETDPHAIARAALKAVRALKQIANTP